MQNQKILITQKQKLATRGPFSLFTSRIKDIPNVSSKAELSLADMLCVDSVAPQQPPV
jgi:hypothetical protein